MIRSATHVRTHRLGDIIFSSRLEKIIRNYSGLMREVKKFDHHLSSVTFSFMFMSLKKRIMDLLVVNSEVVSAGSTFLHSPESDI